MPKSRKRNRAKTTLKAGRPARKLASTTTNQQIAATFFDLIARPNASIKSKTTGNFIKVSKPPKDLKVPDNWDVKPGDILSWSDYRLTEAYFVTQAQTLLKNPDTSGSGYLTIPLSITSHFPDALGYFGEALNAIDRQLVTSIELAPSDAFFASHFSQQPLPASITSRSDIAYSFDPNDDMLYVTVASNPKQSQHFPLSTAKTEEIIEWISSGNDQRAKFHVKYNFEGKATCGKVPRGGIQGLPTGWQQEQQGSITFGEDKIQGEWKCEGPEKTKDKSRKAIEKHYKGLNVEIK